MRANVYEIEENIFEFSKKCIHCGESTYFVLDLEEYTRLFIKNDHVKDVFPYRDKEQHEIMISGTHPECWKEMFGECDD